jgi:hypothetical protein
MKRLFQYASNSILPEECSALTKEYHNDSFVLEDIKVPLNSHEEAIFKLYNIKWRLGYVLEKLPEGVMIGGSTILASMLRNETFTPADVDIYLSYSEANYEKLSLIHDAIVSTYKTEFIILQNKHILNWYFKPIDSHDIPSFQVNLFPVGDWSQIFASYHSDLICVGFIPKTARFIYAVDRWDHFIKTGVSDGCALIRGYHSKV